MIGDLVRGVYDGLRGAAYLLQRPRLWKWVLAPAVLAALILTLAIIWILGLASGPITVVAGFLPGTWAENVLKLAAGVLLAIASFTIFMSVAAVIASPFNEELSESIEENETGVPGPKFRFLRFLVDLVVGMIHALRRVLVYLVVMGTLLIVGLVVPGIGTLIATVLGAIATARFASYDAFDAVWARRRSKYRAKVDYLRANRWRTLGMGAVVAVLAIVPGLNVVGLAIGATAATLRVIDQDRASGRAAMGRVGLSSPG